MLLASVKKTFLFLLLNTIISNGCYINAQQTATFTHPVVTYSEAINLFNNNQYIPAQQAFTKIANATKDETIKGDCAYYIAQCAIRLKQQNADALMERFVETYPTSLKKNQAYSSVAQFYFDNAQYAYARKWLDKVEETNLTLSERERFNFQNGYAYFTSKQYKEASNYFNNITNSTTYGAQAKYYLGYIAYEEDDYNEANNQFNKIENTTTYNKELSYYKADMNFKLGNFDEAIALGLKEYNNSNTKEKSELSKIIGESYFNLQNYAEALPYLKAYQGKNGKWNNTDYYQLGYTYYKIGDFENALNQFNKIVDGENAVAQNAYYHLGDCYLKLDKKQEALNAFKNASQMPFSSEIKENAGFQYVKLSYQIGNSYKSVPETIITYLDEYPKTPHKTLLEELLIDAYVTTKNYEAAIIAMNNNKAYKNEAIYQKVSFLRGIELINDKNYETAVTYLKGALKQTPNQQIKARTLYWLGEAYYNLQDFETAQQNFNLFLENNEALNTSEYKTINYALGYNYLKQKKYTDALNSFKAFTTINATKSLKSDAFLRLGDCQFVNSMYWPALESYNNAISLKNPQEDYANYQKAIGYGFLNRNSQKIEILQNFKQNFPNSIYNDDVLYEWANTLSQEKNTNEAYNKYQKLINDYPQSNWVAKSLLKQALILNNQDKALEALEKFKAVASQFPSTEEAIQAVDAAKLIYIDLGQVQQFSNWASQLEYYSLENIDLDKATFTAAEQPFLEGKKELALSRFAAYLEAYPKGTYILKANYYLAKLYEATNKENALVHYQFIAEMESNEFSEEALVKTAQLLLDKKNNAVAIVYLKKLEQYATQPQNLTFAQSNLMKALYNNEEYENAVRYAEKVLNFSNLPTSLKNDAQIILARASFKTNEYNKSYQYYQILSQQNQGAITAEAFYYLAYFKNNEGAFKASNDLVQKLAKDYASYQEWGAMGLVLMAKNFYQLEDSFQATFILESVIENFTQFPKIVEEAQKELTLIKEALSKNNASVQNK